MSDIKRKESSPRIKPFRKPEKIEAILDAACKVMARKGFAQVSMNDIAKEAGEHKSLLFYYFKNKDQLFLELFHHLSRKYVDMISDIAELPNDFDDKLAKGFNTFHQFMTDDPEWLLMILELIVHSNHNPENKSDVISLYQRLMVLIGSGFTEAEKLRMQERKIDGQVVSSLIIAMMIGLGVLNVLDKQATDFSKAYTYFKDMVDYFIKMKRNDY